MGRPPYGVVGSDDPMQCSAMPNTPPPRCATKNEVDRKRHTKHTPEEHPHSTTNSERLNLYFRIRKWYYRSKADSIYLLEYIFINTVYTINLGRAVDFFGVLILIRPYSIQHVCRVATRDIFWWSPIPATHIHWHLRRSVYSDD